ncbi:MAG: amino acid permease [Nanoarchaeota archaeon]|nr:amino acid permease [Nanoarchaeota archaeon]
MKKELFVAVATLVGFVVGAGILGLPYVFSKSGFLTGILNVVLIGIAVMTVNLMLGEISLRTKTSHQWTGYAGKYLGKKGKKLMLIFLTLGWYGAMIAYIIKVGQFFSALIEPIINIYPIIFSIIFAIAGSYFVFKGLKLIEKSEFLMIAITLLVITIIGIFSIPAINPANLNHIDLSQFWIPFGVVLFAFGGAGAIPEIREELKKNEKLMRNAIIIGTLIPLIIYIVFPLFVVGVTGLETTDGAIIGLGNALGYKMLVLGSFFGILVMSTSFLAVGLAIKEIFKFDYKANNTKSSLLACAFPFIIAIIIIMLNIDNAFYKVIDIIGAFIYPLTSILFVLIFWKAKTKGNRKPEYSLRFSKALGIIIIILFLTGFVNELVRIFF